MTKYVNLMDKFGNSPILNTCSQNFEKSSIERSECLKILLENYANPNIRNKMTGWSCLYWLCFYGDEKSVELILEFKTLVPNNENEEVELHKPDYLGFYPIDLAGKKVKIMQTNGYQN